MSRGWQLGLAGAGVAGLLAWLLAGNLGLFIALTAGFAVSVLVAAARMPRTPRRRRRTRKSMRFPNAAFPAYRKIEETLFWAPVSARHFDHAVRPMLTRLLAAALAERHGVDLTTDRERARELVGADLWPLVDPARRPSDDTHAPGVAMPVVLRFVDRLETL